MKMQFMSEILLKREIERLEGAGRPADCEILYYWCKKELSVIEKLKINKIDMRGEIEEVNHRIMNQEIYFMDPKEFSSMEEKAKKYDIIDGIINSKIKK